MKYGLPEFKSDDSQTIKGMVLAPMAPAGMFKVFKVSVALRFTGYASTLTIIHQGGSRYAGFPGRAAVARS